MIFFSTSKAIFQQFRMRLVVKVKVAKTNLILKPNYNDNTSLNILEIITS